MVSTPRLALITTTINVPKVVLMHAAFAPEMQIYIAGDNKTPHAELRELIKPFPNIHYYDVQAQKDHNFAFSELVGWNKIQRRNFALLKALEDGAEIILTVDDDNLPIHTNYLQDFAELLSQPYTGLQAYAKSGWFDVGRYLEPKVYHRGFPYDWRHKDLEIIVDVCPSAKVGVAAGLWLGDPDIDATTRIAIAPQVHHISQLLESGILVDSARAKTVFNTQNTAILRQYAPALFCYAGPDIGRYDDIWASLVTQRVMREDDYHVHFGKPLVWQERNVHDLNRDLRDEMHGMKYTSQFVAAMDAIQLTAPTVTGKLRQLYAGLKGTDFFPDHLNAQGMAWCDDCDKILEA